MGNSQILKSLRLLYVEDDDVQRKELASFLKRRVHKLYVATQGEEGLEKFRQFEPDAILCDLRMPRMDGLEMAEKIRQLNRTIPIIILTALSDKETILSSVNLNIANYLIKPVDLKKLVEVLEETTRGLRDIGSVQTDDLIDREKLNMYKNEMTKFIKSETGKGPNDVRISIHEDQIKCHISGALTTYEKALITQDKNINLVNYNRDTFYSDRAEVLLEQIKNTLQMKCTLIESKTDAERDETVLLFKVI